MNGSGKRFGALDAAAAVFVVGCAVLGALGGISAARRLDLQLVAMTVAGAAVAAASALLLLGLVALAWELVVRGVPAHGEVAGVGLEPVTQERGAWAWVLLSVVLTAAGVLLLSLLALLLALGAALLGRRGSLPRSWTRRLATSLWAADVVAMVGLMGAATLGAGDVPWYAR